MSQSGSPSRWGQARQDLAAREAALAAAQLADKAGRRPAWPRPRPRKPARKPAWPARRCASGRLAQRSCRRA
ncbi:hypothetical protein ACU4HD_34055 [Cupriavidus basilensis]